MKKTLCDMYRPFIERYGWLEFLRTHDQYYYPRIGECYDEAVRSDGRCLVFILDSKKTRKLCWAAVRQNGLTLGYVPEIFRTYRMCMAAVKGCGRALEYVPDKLITQELCDIAREHGAWPEMIPDRFLMPAGFPKPGTPSPAVAAGI